MTRPDPSTILDGRLLAMWQQLTFDAGMGGADPPAGYGWQQGLAPALPDGSYVVVPQTFFTPSGGDDAVWINNALTQAAQNTGGFDGGKVRLLPLNYSIKSMIVVPQAGCLEGAFPVQADSFSNYGAGILQPQGTVLTATGPFSTGSPPGPAVVACQNATGTQQGAQVLANFSIQGNQTPAGNGVFGILLDGAVGAGFIRDVMDMRTDGACLRAQVDPTSNFVPDQWTIENCVFAASRSSHGVYVDDLPDSNLINVYAHDNALDGFNIKGSVSMSLTACRSETNTGNGFHFTGFPGTGSSYLSLTGCATELNNSSGYLFDSTGFAHPGTYQLTGCRSYGDGLTASGILAGYYDNGSKAAVVLTGCVGLSNGTAPAYGAYEGSVAFGMALTGCRMQGVTAATHDDGTNTNVLSNLSPVPF